MNVLAGFTIRVHGLSRGTLVVGDQTGKVPIGFHERTVVRIHGTARAGPLPRPIVRPPTAYSAVPAHVRRPLSFV
jgi:hypothetical protein